MKTHRLYTPLGYCLMTQGEAEQLARYMRLQGIKDARAANGEVSFTFLHKTQTIHTLELARAICPSWRCRR